MNDKRFRISVDDAKIKELRQSANEMARDMIMSSRNYSTSSKQVIQDIEEQIRLIEKRNKLDQETQRLKVESRYKAGEIGVSERREEMGRLSIQEGTENVQVKLLREIIDTIKSTARDEIRSDRENVQQRIRESKRVQSLSPSGDAEEILKETLQQGMIGDVGREEAQERRDARYFGRSAKAADRTLATAGVSQNEFALLAAGIATIPLVGQGLSTIANRIIQEASRFEQGARRMGQIADIGISGGTAFAGTLPGETYGFNPAESLERYSQYVTAGQQFYGQGATQRAFGAERRLGLDSNQIASVLGTGRYGGQDMTRTIQMFESYLRESDQNISLLPEILQTYTSVANNLLQVSTDIDAQRVAQNVASIGQVTGARGVGLDQWSRGIQGLGRTQNPMVRSMLMRSLIQKYPNKSMFEIQAMMERPMENLDVIGGMFGEMQEGLGGDMAMQAMYSTFGGQVSRSEILRASQEGADFSKLGKTTTDTSMSRLTEGVDQYVGAIERSQKKFDTFFQTYGEKSIQVMDEMMSKVTDMFGGASNPEEYAKKQQDAVREGVKQGMVDYHRENPSR